MPGPRPFTLAALSTLAALGLLASVASAQSQPERPARIQADHPARSLEELLEDVRVRTAGDREVDRDREARFLADRNEQAALLEGVLAELSEEEATSQELESAYAENELALGEREAQLTERLGQMGELFGVVRQVANDLSGEVWGSVTAAQLGPRKDLLDRLGRSKELPTSADLKSLWYELQRELTAQGQVAVFEAEVLTLDGKVERRPVTRVGTFSVISDGEYLLWEAKDQRLRDLARQPPSRYVSTVASFGSNSDGFAPLALDPTRGALLSALTDTPNATERIQQGGFVGYTIIALGIVTLLIGVFRMVSIARTGRKVRAQIGSQPRDDNPLGRILQIHASGRDLGSEALELRLDEAVLRESARIERFVWLVQVGSVVAPLLGLLGTVTGMIQTFQAITLFGAGDPKMMAGGISEALVTTMLGLTIAIPLVLLHAALSSAAQRIVDVLDEQTAGLLAERAEEAGV